MILKSDLERWRRPYGEEPKKLFNDSAFHIMGGKQEKKDFTIYHERKKE